MCSNMLFKARHHTQGTYMIVLLSYIKCVFAPSTSHSFCFKGLYLGFFLSPCNYPRSEPYHCWSYSLLHVPLPRLYSLLNHRAVINKHIIHPQFLHIALFTVYISFDAIVFALKPVCLRLLHMHNPIIIICFTKHCAATQWQVFLIKL